MYIKRRKIYNTNEINAYKIKIKSNHIYIYIYIYIYIGNIGNISYKTKYTFLI